MVRRPPRVSIDPIFEPVEPVKPPPDDDPMLTRVSITFHTNDEDKDHDTAVGVYVKVLGRLQVAYIYDEFGKFDDHSDSGPYTLLLQHPVPRSQFKKATVELGIDPIVGFEGAGDTWRFDFVLDLRFADGGHLLARATGLELATFHRTETFGIE